MKSKMSEKTPEHINFRRWLRETEFIPQRPKEAHLLAVTDKKTGKVCDIAIAQDEPPYHNRGWKLKCLYPRTRYSIERMQTNLRGITNR